MPWKRDKIEFFLPDAERKFNYVVPDYLHVPPLMAESATVN
jgi:hypothetical protein